MSGPKSVIKKCIKRDCRKTYKHAELKGKSAVLHSFLEKWMQNVGLSVWPTFPFYFHKTIYKLTIYFVKTHSFLLFLGKELHPLYL